jgi:hypothetical protein
MSRFRRNRNQFALFYLDAGRQASHRATRIVAKHALWIAESVYHRRSENDCVLAGLEAANICAGCCHPNDAGISNDDPLLASRLANINGTAEEAVLHIPFPTPE